MNRFSCADLDSDSDFESGMSCSGGRCCRSGNGVLQFDPTSLENIILKIADTFDVRIVLNNNRVKGAMIVTTGMAVAGGFIGNHYGGRMGAIIGSAVAGACGLGLVAVSMRDVWNDIKSQLPELYDIVYDYLSGLGIEDYMKAALFISQESGINTELVMVIIQFVSSTLGKQVLSSLQPALA